MGTWSKYLQLVRYYFVKPLLPPINFFDERNRIYLFIDVYRGHKCQEIIDLATSLNIDITVIPSGMTKVHQSLDVKIFGIMKQKARAF